MRAPLLLLLLICSACLPAKVPPHLSYTPGAAVVVAEGRVQFAGIYLRYPAGWRVITGAADSPVHLTFVSPQDDALIVISTSSEVKPPALPDLPPEQQQTSSERVEVNGRTIYTWFVYSSSSYGPYLPDYHFVIESLIH
jgi:hypothetical protein